MQKQSPANHGEGNPEAAKRFNEAEQAFVRSADGKQKIREGAKIRPEEESSLAEAEQLGRDRSKGEDST